MTKKIKLLFKKVIITILIILTLFPALFSGFAYGADSDVLLTTERAGNFVSSFAINFFKNWSNINYIYSENSTSPIRTSGEFIFPVTDTNVGVSRGFSREHQGYDIYNFGAAEGVVDIYSVCSGEVVQAGFESSMGNYVIVSMVYNGQTYWIRYMHMSGTPLVRTGDSVEAGTPLGKMGNTGASEGTHLHIDFSVGTIDEAERLVSELGDYLYSTTSYRYFFDPLNFIPSIDDFLSGNSSSTTESSPTTNTRASSTRSVETYGEIKTEYDSTRDERSTPVDPEDETYKFSNKSFIDFAFKNALGLQNDRYYPISNYSSTSEYFNEIGDEYLADDGLIDINEMANSGKLLPGDILYTSHGLSGTQGDYLLYVGGSKVIYAARPYRDEGALRYEYIQNYLARVKNSLSKTILQAQPNLDRAKIKDYLPAYGVKKIYRLNNELIREANIVQSNANLFFNGKGYYDPNTKYDGIPKTGEYRGTQKRFDIVKSLSDMFWFLVSGITYAVRAFAIGCISMVDIFIQYVVLQLSGTVSHAPIMDPTSGVSAFSYASNKVSIESIFFNGIPILDANFFNFETAAGHDITAIDANGKPTMIYVLKRNLALWYVLIRNFSIALMLFMLLYAGIRMAIATTAEKKASYTKMLIDWAAGFAIVVFIHFFMYAVIALNDGFVKLLYNMMTSIVNETMNGKVDEFSFYEMIRTKAYVFDFRESMAGIILYVILIYLLVRFLFIYFKRLLSTYVLGMLGSFIGVKYAWDKANGKKKTSLGFWMKDFAFNVLLQSIHCLIYVLFITVAFSTAMDGITGIVFSLIILRFMIDADKIFMKVFGVRTKGGLFDDVNNPEKFTELIGHAGLITVGARNVTRTVGNAVDGKNGLVRQVMMGVLANPDDDYKKAQKKVDMFKYKTIGKGVDWLEKNFPELLRLQRRMDFLRLYSDEERHKLYKLLAANLSDETKLKIYGNIHKKHDLIKQQYTRPWKTTKNLVKSTYGILATPAMIVSGDSGWALATASTLRSIRGFRKEFDMQAAQRYRRNMDGYYTPGVLGSMTIKEQRALKKFNKDIEKIEGKDNTILTMAKYEESIKESIDKLKENTAPEDLDKLIKEYQDMISKSSKTNISAAKIQKAISTYMIENRKKKLEDSDLEHIMEKLQTVLDEKKSNSIKVRTGNATKDDKLVNDLRTSFNGKTIDGLDSKKAAALLTEALNLPGMVGNRFTTSATGDTQTELENIYTNLKRIYSLNERSKIENKGEAVSFGAMKKEFHKKMMEVKK